MSDNSAVQAHSFQVDLRGLVDLLSHHLYSSPRVYVRELMQNAVDAITARRQGDPAAPATIRITVGEAGLSISDSGVGLTEADAHRFLATIGNSSKRDDLAGARQEFLGQFDTDTLRPTASREALYEDETLAAVREALGARIRDWLTGLAAQEPQRLAAFLSVHALGVKALARHDRGLLQIMLPYLRFESTDGLVPLADFARNHPHLYVTPTVEEFRQVAPIASAQGIGVINGGYTYDSELVALLPELMPGVRIEELDTSVLTAALDPVDPSAELAMAGFLAMARGTLDPLDCDVILRAFHPASVSALHLDSRGARSERARAQVAADADDLWAKILGALKSSAPRAQLVLNHHNPVVRRLARIQDAELLSAAVESLYGQALLMTHRPPGNPGTRPGRPPSSARLPWPVIRGRRKRSRGKRWPMAPAC